MPPVLPKIAAAPLLVPNSKPRADARTTGFPPTRPGPESSNSPISPTLERVTRFIQPPGHCRDAFVDCMRRVLEGEDSLNLAELAQEIYWGLHGSDGSRPDFVWLCHAALSVGPLVRGAVVRTGWTDGKVRSRLRAAGYSMTEILRWFRQSSPDTIMHPAERQLLTQLPPIVTAWRGASGTNLTFGARA
jgi:hypothetical protein